MTKHLCDVNVWLALTLSEHVHHPVARDWLATVEHPRSVVFTRSTQMSLLRLLTTSAVLGAYGNAPLTNDEAWQVAEAFLADDRIVLETADGRSVGRRWQRFARRDAASPKLWMDAYLAAIAVAQGFTLVTTDAAFRQFAGLDLIVLGGAADAQ